MAINPILFSTPMVQAILDGRKTMTRRVIKPTYREDESGFCVVKNIATGNRWVEKWDENECTFDNPRYVWPKYETGDILWVRETWCENKAQNGQVVGFWHCATCDFNANGECSRKDDVYPWNHTRKPSIFMPRDACRLFLRVTAVRAERLQDMSYDRGR